MPGIATTASAVAVCAALAAVAHDAYAQRPAGDPASPPAAAVTLIDSTGRVAARVFADTVVLVTMQGDVTAPASIGPVHDADGHMASGLASWRSGGSVLFTSSDCTTGAYVHAGTYPGARAASQVQTPDGIILHVGAIGTAGAVDVRSIRYDTGCSPVSVRQDGLFPVVTTLNLTATHPPPLSLR